MMIEEFGPHVTTVWNHLRPTTKNLVERAWQSSNAGVATPVPRSTAYDPRADRELSQLLSALDERADETESSDDERAAQRTISLADACAHVLQQQTQSAEVFAQLIERAHRRKNYAQVDLLAGLLPERLAPSELSELGRSANVVARALAYEALTQLPTSVLARLLRDPIDAAVARQALERQAIEFGSEEARRVLQGFDELGPEEF